MGLQKSLNIIYVLNIHMTAKNIQLNFTPLEIEILKFLFKHYQDKYNARQLSRILKINHAHANKLCNLLTKKQLLVKENLGNSAYFSFNYNFDLANRFIEYALSQENFPAWLLVPLHSLVKFSNLIEFGIIFGSSVKIRDFNDIDVLLAYDGSKSKEISKIKDEIRKSGIIIKPIRYVDIAWKDLSLNKKEKVFYSIMSESLVFYNPLKYAEAVRECRK